MEVMRKELEMKQVAMRDEIMSETGTRIERKVVKILFQTIGD